MITEDRIQVFIDGVNRYFKEINNMDIAIETPYLVENKAPVAHDYTGIIGISGPYRGSVYVTAPKVLLRHLLLAMKEDDNSESNLLDLIGEIANTIAGNARAEYGGDFMISVPVVVKGTPDEIYLPREARSYVIPLSWQNCHAAIVVCLNDN